MSNIISLSKLDTFGDIAAEDDAVLDYFLSTSDVQRIAGGNILLVLGRKGTGKTAIVRHFTERREDLFARHLNLRGYPWSVHAQRIDYGASDIEAYVSSWKYLIAVELAALVLGHPQSDVSPSANALKTFLRDNYGGPDPKISDIIRPNRLRLGKLSLQPSVMGNQIGGVDLERKKKDHQFGLELDAVTSSIMDAVFSIIQHTEIEQVSLHFDELDQGLSTIDDERRKMLIGLILAARDVRRLGDWRDFKLSPIIYLRTDIWDELHFSDKNKISQTQALNLGWNGINLLKLVEARLHSRLAAMAKWENVASEDLMRGSQTKWNHILARTFLRPRDVIRFLNIILSKAKIRDGEPISIENRDIVDSREEYSGYLKAELDDEIKPHWSNWDSALQACSAISTITFDKVDFIKEYDRRKSPSNTTTAEEALSILYRFSVIGYEKRSGYGGSGWAFQYADPEAGWDNSATRFKVHLGLKEYAKLREIRQ